MNHDEKITKLPAWAREYIRELKERSRTINEPLLNELAKLRPQVAILKAKNEAMRELLDCAATGGHKQSKEIVEILQDYNLTLVPRE